jgi:hypothetical protein
VSWTELPVVPNAFGSSAMHTTVWSVLVMQMPL